MRNGIEITCKVRIASGLFAYDADRGLGYYHDYMETIGNLIVAFHTNKTDAGYVKCWFSMSFVRRQVRCSLASWRYNDKLESGVGNVQLPVQDNESVFGSAIGHLLWHNNRLFLFDMLWLVCLPHYSTWAGYR